MLDHWSASTSPPSPDVFPAEVRQEYVAKLSDPATVHAICEEYRAAATLDCEHDEADRGRVKIACPVLARWARDGVVGRWYEPLDVWRRWADDVESGPIAAGHFLPEEAPEEIIVRFRDFFGAAAEERTRGG